MMSPYIVCDIDGVLAHRPKVIGPDKTLTDPTDYSFVGTEYVNRGMRAFINLISLPVILLTGRRDFCRDQTEDWLARHLIFYYYVVMKPEGYLLDDVAWKDDALRHLRMKMGAWPSLFIDNEIAITKHVEEVLGLTVFHYSPTIDETKFHW